MPLPDGYRQIRGNRSRVLTPTGEIISRGQAETLFAQQHGFRSDYHYRQYSRRIGRSEQSKAQLRDARNRGASAKDIRALQAREIREREQGLDTRRAGGPIHHLNAQLGYVGWDDESWITSPSVRGVGG